jgi:hypothetical protein
MEMVDARFDEDASAGATNQPWVNESHTGDVLLLKYLIKQIFAVFLLGIEAEHNAVVRARYVLLVFYL